MKSKNIILMLLLIFCSLARATQDIYYFAEPKSAAQFNHLLHELRCVVCQNQDLADSHAAIAADLRAVVYKLVKNGRSDQEVLQYLTQRYGDFILFKPPMKTITMFLWFGPAIFLSLGLFVFIRKCLR